MSWIMLLEHMCQNCSVNCDIITKVAKSITEADQVRHNAYEWKIVYFIIIYRVTMLSKK